MTARAGHTLREGEQVNGQRALILDYEHHLEAFAARLVDRGYKARLRALPLSAKLV